MKEDAKISVKTPSEILLADGLSDRVLDLPRRDKQALEAMLDGHQLLGELRRLFKMARRRDRKIIIGPWLSEVGFELLYWIPFIQWLCEEHGLDGDDCVILSRGGCQNWYRHISEDYLDILDFYSVEEFCKLNEARIHRRGGRKQMEESELDIKLRKIAQKKVGQQCMMLHPRYLFRLFQPFWKQQLGMNFLRQRTRIKPITGFGMDTLKPLGLTPGSYVAVKFYEGSSFSRDDVQRCVEHVRRLADGRQVVHLNTTFEVDDHRDSPILEGLSAAEVLQPSSNLGQQSELIAHAGAFLGTYGGFSYLACLSGVDCYAYFSKLESTLSPHYQIARTWFQEEPWGRFYPVDLNMPAI